MFEDITLLVMMQLALAVVKENLGNFLPALLQQASDGTKPATA